MSDTADSDDEEYCKRHDIHYGVLTGHDHCPMCHEERRIREAEAEMLGRRANEDMHPDVDARRR